MCPSGATVTEQHFRRYHHSRGQDHTTAVSLPDRADHVLFLTDTSLAELPIVFGTIRTIQYRDPQPYEIEASNYMQSAWVAFAKDPQQGLTEFGWPRYNPTRKTLSLFVSISRAVEHRR